MLKKPFFLYKTKSDPTPFRIFISFQKIPSQKSWNLQKVKNPSTLTESKKFLYKMIASMEALLMGSVKLCCSVLVLISLHIIKYLKNLETNFLKRSKNMFYITSHFFGSWWYQTVWLYWRNGILYLAII